MVLLSHIRRTYCCLSSKASEVPRQEAVLNPKRVTIKWSHCDPNILCDEEAMNGGCYHA